jgi:hypothetical protein
MQIKLINKKGKPFTKEELIEKAVKNLRKKHPNSLYFFHRITDDLYLECPANRRRAGDWGKQKVLGMWVYDDYQSIAYGRTEKGIFSSFDNDIQEILYANKININSVSKTDVLKIIEKL